MPRVVQAQIVTATGDRVDAPIANLTPSGVFFRAGERLRFAQSVTVKIAGHAVSGQVLFLSAAPLGAVIALRPSADAVAAIQALAPEVEQLDPPEPKAPDELWSETTNAQVVSDAPATLGTDDLQIIVDPTDVASPLDPKSAYETVEDLSAIAKPSDPDVPIAASLLAAAARDDRRPPPPELDIPILDPLLHEEPILPAAARPPLVAPPRAPSVSQGLPRATRPRQSSVTGPVASNEGSGPHAPRAEARLPAPSSPDTPAPRAEARLPAPSSPDTPAPRAEARLPAPSSPDTPAPPRPIAKLTPRRTSSIQRRAPLPRAVSEPRLIEDLLADATPPNGASVPSAITSAESPKLELVETPAPKLPAADECLPVLDRDGYTVRFASAAAYAVQYGANIEHGGLVVSAPPMPIGTQRMLALEVPGRPAYTVSARVIYNQDGRLGFMLDSFSLHKVHLKSLAS